MGDIIALSPVICREAGPADWDAVARIWLDGWESTGIALASPPTYPVLRERIEREAMQGGWVIFVAEAGQAIAGFVAISPSAGALEQIFVAPAAHRLGVGTALLALARRQMPGGFTLWTHGDNHAAAAFYARSGMTFIGPGVHPRQGHTILTYGFGPVSA